MIPKIIHYCWFGRAQYPDKVKECMKSWERNLPDYKFMLWNEDNFDVNSTVWTKQTYEKGNFAFVSDYVRIYALKEYGGIYLDTDIEILKPLDEFLNNRVVLGTDDAGYLTAYMASERNHPYFIKLLDMYNNMSFIDKQGLINSMVNNTYMQEILKEFGYKRINRKQILDEGIVVFPCEYFHAKSLTSGKYYITDNTHAIHHHTLLWVSPKTKMIKFIRMKIIVPIIGTDAYDKLVSKLKHKGKTEKYE